MQVTHLFSRTRVIALSSAVALLASVVSTVSAQMAPLGVGACPAGRLGLTIVWSDAQVSMACTMDPGLHSPPAEVVGLVVRWSDGSTDTLEVAAPEAAAVPSSSPASSISTSTSTSSSISTSSSTTCINGQCTTSTTHTVCHADDCSSEP